MGASCLSGRLRVDLRADTRNQKSIPSLCISRGLVRMSDDERCLIERAQVGERSALGALYRQHYPAIFTYLFYRLGDQAAAEDLAAEVFVRMVEQIDRYRDQGRPILAWLYTIARNLLTDHYRRNGRAHVMPLDEQLVAGSDNPVMATDRRLDKALLLRALRRLTETQRQVIVGRFVEERPNAELATILDKTEGAVKSLQHRALAALRRAIEEEGRDEV
jgi:RNA polymerase sigma-70 factor, ECF subfamily